MPRHDFRKSETNKENLNNLINSWFYLNKIFRHNHTNLLGYIGELFCQCYLGVNLNEIKNAKDTDGSIGDLSVQIKSKSFFKPEIPDGAYFDLGYRVKARLYYFLIFIITKDFCIKCFTIPRDELEKCMQIDKRSCYIVNIKHLLQHKDNLRFKFNLI